MPRATPTAAAPGASIWSRCFAPVDIAALVYFRIVFGAIMLWEVWRYFEHGWIARYWIEPPMRFTYYGFDWLSPWPGDGMYLHFIALGVLALCIVAGVAYRFSSALFFVGFTYIFLLEQARYLNHFYLICLISLLMIFLPAHRAVSVDAALRPSTWSATAPAWTLWLLRVQLGIVYFFGGVAKLNADWLRGEPLREWLARRTDVPVVGPYFTEEWMVSLFSYGGLLLDLLIVPFLLWRRTRLAAFVLAVGFHLMNARLFSIGIFPWFMIAATALYFDPGWPRTLVSRLRPRRATEPVESGEGRQPAGAERLRPRQVGVLAAVGVYLVLQTGLPLRHHLYPGHVGWTEQGHRFAWRMKLRDKAAEARFLVTDPVQNVTQIVDPDDYLPRWQARKMATRPDMILQFSHQLASEMRQRGLSEVEVRASVTASLNGRAPQLLIDSVVDLAAQPRTLRAAPWILPLLEERTGR